MGIISKIIEFISSIGDEFDKISQQKFEQKECEMNNLANEKNIKRDHVETYIEYEKLLSKASEFLNDRFYEECVDNALPVYAARYEYGGYGNEYIKTDTYLNQFNRAKNILDRVSDDCMEIAHDYIDRAKNEYDADRQDEGDFRYYLNEADKHIDIAEESQCGDQRDVYDTKWESKDLYEKGKEKTNSRQTLLVFSSNID